MSLRSSVLKVLPVCENQLPSRWSKYQWKAWQWSVDYLNLVNGLSSVSRQDEPSHALWLATQLGKMELSWLLRATCCIPQERFPQKPYNKSLIDQACSVKMVGYWPCSLIASLWTSCNFVSVHKHAKKTLANIQPSWPHTWSITHFFIW